MPGKEETKKKKEIKKRNRIKIFVFGFLNLVKGMFSVSFLHYSASFFLGVVPIPYMLCTGGHFKPARFLTIHVHSSQHSHMVYNHYTCVHASIMPSHAHACDSMIDTY